MDAPRINLIGRMTLLAAALHAILGLYAFGVVLPQIAVAFKDTPNAALLSQMVGGITGLAFAVGSLTVGPLIEKQGYARVYLWSSVLFAAAGVAPMLLDNLYLILATRIVLGVAVAGALVASITGLSTLPDRQRARLLGMQTLVGGGLGLLSYFVVAKLAALGWRAPFALYLLGIAMVPFILMLPRERGTPGHAHAEAPVPGHSRALLGGLAAPLLLITLFTGMTGVMPVLFGPFYLAGIGVTDPTMVALPLMAAALLAMPAAGFYGWMQARIGINGMFALCLLFIAAGTAMAGFTGTVGQFAVAMMVMSVGLGLSAPNVNAAAVASAPHNPSRAIGVVNGVYYGAQALLPFIGQGITRSFGPSAVFETYALVAILWGAGYCAAALAGRRAPQPSMSA